LRYTNILDNNNNNNNNNNSAPIKNRLLKPGVIANIKEVPYNNNYMRV